MRTILCRLGGPAVGGTWCLGLWLGLALAAPPAVADPSPGRLLYETHCIACHTTQMHWRDKRIVDSWASLLREVAGWQGRERLNWSREEIEAVARHLDETIYRLADAPTRAE